MLVDHTSASASSSAEKFLYMAIAPLVRWALARQHWIRRNRLPEEDCTKQRPALFGRSGPSKTKKLSTNRSATLWRFLKSLFHGLRRMRNYRQQNTGSPIWIATTLFPLPKRPKIEPKLQSELRLAHTQPFTQVLHVDVVRYFVS